MIYIPKCARGITTLAASEVSRYSLTGCRVTTEVGGGFRIEATDGRFLGILRGVAQPSEQEQLAAANLPQAETILKEALLPAKDLAEMLGCLGKKGNPANHLAVQLSVPVLLQAGKQTRQVEVIDGRFPETSAVIPKRGALCTIRLDPHKLCTLLKAAAQIAEAGDESAWIELHYFDRNSPIGVTTRSKTGLTFDGLLMPLT